MGSTTLPTILPTISQRLHAFLLLAALGLPACGETPATISTGCNVDADCKSGRVCGADATCVPAGGGAGGSGGSNGGGSGGGGAGSGGSGGAGGEPPAAGALDVLFVIDDTISMSRYQDRLSASFHGFVEGVAAVDERRAGRGEAPLALHVGFTTTSVFARYELLGSVRTERTYPVVCDDAAKRGHPFPQGALTLLGNQEKYLTGLSAEELSAAENGIHPGLCGSWQEQGLLAIDLALSDRIADGTNLGFLRPEADLLVVILTDEDDCSDPEEEVVIDPTGRRDLCAEEAARPDDGLLGPATMYVEVFHQRKQGRRVTLGAFIGLTPDGEPGSCDGAATGDSRYAEVARALDGEVANLCQESYAADLARLLTTASP